MKLIPISDTLDHAKLLYDLLAQRPVAANISHKKMPSWGEHLDFIASSPYRAWYLVQPGSSGFVGSIYLSKQNEIGVAIFPEFQGRGHGTQAVLTLMQQHGPGQYLANVAPKNEASRKMFEKLGFKLVQHTYALEAE